MADQQDQQLTPDEAWARAQQMDGRVRTAGRWHGWMWVALAILTPIFLLGTRPGGLPRAAHFWVAAAFAAIGLVLVIWNQRRAVIGRQTARVDRPATAAYAIAVFAVAVVIIGWDPELTAWFTALALLPSLPCVWAAWRVLRG